MLIMGFSSLLVLAQKESGIVYSEHDAIGKTRALWAAMIQGNKEKFCSFFADTVMLVQNDKSSTQLKNEMGGFVDFWKRFTKAEIKDNPPAIIKIPTERASAHKSGRRFSLLKNSL